MNPRNLIASFARAFSLFALVAISAAAAFPSASHAAAAPGTSPVAIGKVTIFAVDQFSGKVIPGAEVVFRRADSRVIVTKGVTNSFGYLSIELPVGSYTVDLDAAHYKHATSSASVAAGINTSTKVGMYPDSKLSDPPPPMLSID